MNAGDSVSLLEELTENSRVKSETDRRRADDSKKKYDSYSRLLELLKNGHPAALVTAFEKDFRHTVSLYSLYAHAKEKATKSAAAFSRLFPEACRNARIMLDDTSRHPEYYVRGRFITISVNARRLKLQVTNREARPKIMSTDIGPLVAYLQRQICRLFESERKTENLLEGILTAYRSLLDADNKPIGTALPIRRIAKQLAGTTKHFRLDEFNVDLGTAVQSGVTSVDGMRFRYEYTRNTTTGMLLYGLEGSGYIDMTWFESDA